MTDRARLLSNTDRRQDYPNTRPRDAATLMIVDKSDAEPRVLMGRRSDKHVFYPGKFVFPGGRVDACDSRIAGPNDLDPVVKDKLLHDMKGVASENRALALARAALRETFEETGLLIGRRQIDGFSTRSPVWRNFLGHGVVPSLQGITFFARAITPPRRPRRYDTRFFSVNAKAIAATDRPQDSELLDLHWLTHDEALALELPRITQVILDELFEQISKGRTPRPDDPVPYYFMRHGQFVRHTI